MLKTHQMSDYRERIYEAYVNARQESLAPESLAGLRPRAPYLNKVIRIHFPENRDANILDLGCGHGTFVYFCRKAGFKNVIGIDKSPQQVAEAQRLGIEGCRQGDLMQTLQSTPTSSQDVVIAFDVIEHFKKEELLLLVDETNRVLKEDGRWIIHTPNGEALFGSRMVYWDFTHEIAFTRESISQLLKSSGFPAVVCMEDAPVPHGLKSATRWALWKACRGALRFYLAIETGAGAKDCIFSQNFLTVARKQM